MNHHTYKILKNAIGFSIVLIVLLNARRSEAQISTATITVNDTSQAPTGITPVGSTVCAGGSAPLSVQGGQLGPGAQWVWYDTDPTVGSPVSIDTGASISVSPTATTTYYVRAEGGTCNATTAAASTVVTLTTSPTFAVTDTVLCNGETVTLAFTGNATTFDYSGGVSVGLADATGQSSISFTSGNVSTTDTLSRVITITPHGSGGCTGTPQTVTVTVMPTINMNAVSDTVLCNGLAVHASNFGSAINDGTMSYAWTNNRTSIGLAASGSGNYASFNAVNLGNADSVATISVIPSNTIGNKTCAGSAENYTITVHPLPVGALAAGSAVCEGTSPTIRFTPTNGIAATNNWTLSINNSASSNAGTNDYTTTLNGLNTAVPITGLPAATTTNTTYGLWKITDQNGCINQQ